ncbi:MobF family relaxase [Plantibacter auratus]|uniref:MobF family relaxase n=1 Tax=Plantibacter auratus TaxID=272914 RepID=UPI003D326CC4
MRGGLVFFRGAGAAARAYLESDHSHADEYYLADAGAVAQWTAWDTRGLLTADATLSGTDYQAWVDWKEPETGASRGRPREETRVTKDGEVVVNPASPRFVEMTVNCDKSLSVAAALNPAVSAALDEAQAAAAEAMNKYMAQNTVTRTGPRGEQRLVPVERLESVSVVHRSSRAGDPHRHVHVQWNTRVFAEGKWRGMHTAATLKQQGALRGVGEAAIHSHDGLQEALAAAGFTFDPSTGKVTNLEQQARTMSKRANQIQSNLARFEAAWREQHPGQEPDAAVLRRWDQQAWAFERPQKVQATESAESKWLTELRDAGLQVDGFEPVELPASTTLNQLDRAAIAEHVVTVAGARSSAWSLADLEGHIGVLIGAAGVTAAPERVVDYARNMAKEIAGSLPSLPVEVTGQLPNWVRHYTSEHVQRIERELREGFAARGLESGLALDANAKPLKGLNAEQSLAARALATRAPLVVIEGAAGSGKTTMLAAAKELAAREVGASEATRFVVLAPTLRAANEAAASIGAAASSAHKLVHEHGFRWDDDGRWTRLEVGDVDPVSGAVYEGPSEVFAVDADTRLVIDEAGMLDQDLMHAVMTVAGEGDASLALIGDRAQLPAIGRGGVLDMAVAASPRPLDLSELYRFREEGYADLTLQMRDREAPGALFDKLHERGNIVIHDTDEAAWAAITSDVAAKAEAGATVAVAVATNEQAAEVNALVQAAHERAGRTRTPAVEVAGSDSLTLRIGDRLMTRQNNSELGVANRDTWTVDRVHEDGSVQVSAGARKARLPREYVEEHTHLAYASTEYGVQGATVDYGHGVVSDGSSAQAVYVAATRGRAHNALHIVAGDRADARDLFVTAMGREAGDRGTAAAIAAVERDVEGVVLPDSYDRELRAARLAAEERVHRAEVRAWESAREQWQSRHPETPVDDYAAAVQSAGHEADAATQHRAQLEGATSSEAVAAGEQQWVTDYAAVERAESAAASASVFRRAAAQKEAEAARRAFEDRHRVAPTPRPSEAQRQAWARAAVAAGAGGKLGAARAAEQRAIAHHNGLRRDPAPTAKQPAAPQPGTPAQEKSKDNAHAERQRGAAVREQQRDARLARERQQSVPDKSPSIER